MEWRSLEWRRKGGSFHKKTEADGPVPVQENNWKKYGSAMGTKLSLVWVKDENGILIAG